MKRKILVVLSTIMLCAGVFIVPISAGILHVERFEVDKFADLDLWRTAGGHNDRYDSIAMGDGQLILRGRAGSELLAISTTEVFEDNYAFRVLFEMDIPSNIDDVINRFWMAWDGGESLWFNEIPYAVSFTAGLSEDIGGTIRLRNNNNPDLGDETQVEYNYPPGGTAVFDVIIAVKNGVDFTVIVKDGEGSVIMQEQFSDAFFALGSSRVNFNTWMIESDIRIKTVVIGESLEDVENFEL